MNEATVSFLAPAAGRGGGPWRSVGLRGSESRAALEQGWQLRAEEPPGVQGRQPGPANTAACGEVRLPAREPPEQGLERALVNPI